MPLGELAAIGAALCWSITSIAFAEAGRIVGSPIVNRTRLLLAVGMVMSLNWILQGQALPVDAELFRWRWLALSAVLGLGVGDALLFQAFVMIGARLSMLMMAMVPVFGVIMGWTLLDENLSAIELTGIAITILGVGWVITERTTGTGNAKEQSNSRYFMIGILCGLGGAAGQAGGLVTSKFGLKGN